jgi:hypothetical protein
MDEVKIVESSKLQVITHPKQKPPVGHYLTLPELAA